MSSYLGRVNVRIWVKSVWLHNFCL